jgi:hypothetical protein
MTGLTLSALGVILVAASSVHGARVAGSTSLRSIPPAAWAQLAAAISGDVVLPSSPAYANSTVQWNSRFVTAPAGVVYCTSASDVSASILFAQQ